MSLAVGMERHRRARGRRLLHRAAGQVRDEERRGVDDGAVVVALDVLP
jgi:hypothetical protein